MMRKKMTGKAIALLLAMVMIVSLLPTTVFAAETTFLLPAHSNPSFRFIKKKRPHYVGSLFLAEREGFEPSVPL